MAKFRNFTLEGKALSITAHIELDGRTAYTVELNPQFEKESMTWEELNKFRKAIKDDADVWSGIVNDGNLDDFEESWKGDEEECSTEDL